MCGRFTRMYSQKLVAPYRLTLSAPPSNLQPRYNICPTADVDVTISSDCKRTFEMMRWPHSELVELHDRMPVILEAKDFVQWQRGDAKDAAALMKSAGEDVLQKWPVSRRVNSSRAAADDESLIEPMENARARSAICGSAGR